MKAFSVVSAMMIISSSVTAQEAEEFQVRVTNVPLVVKEDSVAVGGLRATPVTVTNGSQTVVFNELVNLIDISFSPVPAFTKRLSGVCQVRLLVNEVPMKIAGYSLVGTLSQQTGEPDSEGDLPPEGLVTTVPLYLWGYGSSLMPNVTIELTPNDVIRIETVPLPRQLDCTADFVIVAEAVE